MGLLGIEKSTIKTHKSMINYSITMRSANSNLLEINQAKSRINQAVSSRTSLPMPSSIS